MSNTKKNTNDMIDETIEPKNKKSGKKAMLIYLLIMVGLIVVLMVGMFVVSRMIDPIAEVDGLTFQKVETASGDKSFEFVGLNETLKEKLMREKVSVTIPETCKGKPVTGSVGGFSRCVGLTSITIPNGMTGIDDYAFSGCSSLASVKIGNGVTDIGKSAFNNCFSLESLEIPDSVTRIGIGAFSNCSGLTGITIPGSVTSIGQDAFRGCAGLTNITFKGTKEQWKVVSQTNDGGLSFHLGLGTYTVHCTDGDISY